MHAGTDKACILESRENDLGLAYMWQETAGFKIIADRTPGSSLRLWLGID